METLFCQENLVKILSIVLCLKYMYRAVADSGPEILHPIPGERKISSIEIRHKLETKVSDVGLQVSTLRKCTYLIAFLNISGENPPPAVC